MVHFVTGGACNGKAEWVRTFYQDSKFAEVSWIKAYESKGSEPFSTETSPSLFVIEGVEYWIRELSLEYSSDEARRRWKDFLYKCMNWETGGSERKVVLIGSDITRGIVPIEKVDRKWRDDVGWAYQDTVVACERVEHIWYGIGQRLK